MFHSSFLSANAATKHFGVTTKTLCNWEKKGKIASCHSPCGHWLYKILSVIDHLVLIHNNHQSGIPCTAPATTYPEEQGIIKHYIYACVSSAI